MKYLWGPELLWLVFYGLARIVFKMNKAPNYPFDFFTERCWFWVPVLVLCTFSLYWAPFIEKNWLLLRIWFMGIFLGHLVLDTLIKANSSQGPGAGMGYLVGILFIVTVLVIGSIIVRIIH